MGHDYADQPCPAVFGAVSVVKRRKSSLAREPIVGGEIPPAPEKRARSGEPAV